MPKICKRIGGRVFKGSVDLTSGNVDREAQCAFNDIGSLREQKLCPLSRSGLCFCTSADELET